MSAKDMARSLANELVLELQRTHLGPISLRIDYSIGPEDYLGFTFVYHSNPYRIIFDLGHGRITRYRLTNPSTHYTLNWGAISAFNARRLHMLLIKEKKIIRENVR